MPPPQAGFGLAFAEVYALTLAVSLAMSHAALTRYARVVGPSSRYGHWYYPLPASQHARLFGLVQAPHLGERAWHGVFVALLGALAASAGGALGDGHSRVWSWLALACALLYFARARTHGLVHNKADTVPWVLFICAAVPPAHAPSVVRVLLATVYASSGLHKLRKHGLKV